MSRQKVLFSICAIIFLLGTIGSLLLLLAPHGAQVNIVQDGEVLYSFDLATAQDQILDIKYDGRINIVQIEDGRIRMMEAECPDKTCVHMGWLNSKAMPIVCLPNHLSIEFTDSENDVDAVIR
ncbi:NusG domain II-containing protein [Enterocloster bolteae]|uniref:NusG domain II-containing protein n=1 Tax=Enterocloster bolteae TaxID=208479 RepID=UPI0028DC0768|nr:NusG domain II-containing protein [Enterocloster bolteae]